MFGVRRVLGSRRRFSGFIVRVLQTRCNTVRIHYGRTTSDELRVYSDFGFNEEENDGGHRARAVRKSKEFYAFRQNFATTPRPRRF